MLTDLTPPQQAAAIVMRLGGVAREAARAIAPHELIHGAVINGIQLDPVALIMTGLEMQFAQLNDEARLAAMNEFLSFRRHPGEDIDAL